MLSELHAAFKPRGVLFSSNPRGDNRDGASRALRRLSPPRNLAAFVIGAGFTELEHYYRPPGQPREQQPWLATVWRR